MDERETIDVVVDARYPYEYSMGTIPSRFFAAIRDEKKILGKKCPKCGTVYVPPRPVCGPCFEETGEWVEVGPRGSLVAYTVVYFTFLDPMTGKKRPVPYGYGIIRLDGTDRRLQHFLSENELDKLKVGMRVEAVFADEREGSLADIIHFRPVED